MIVKNNLLNFKNKIIYQDNSSFLFSLDSVLLANFVSINMSTKNIIDLCTGNGPIPMLLTFRTNAKITGIEIQKEIYDLAVLSAKENNMLGNISYLNMDVNKLVGKNYDEKYDVVTCNPPYFKVKEKSLLNDDKKKTIARHEVCVTLDDIIRVSKYLLKTGGNFAMVHRPDRMVEILFIMRKYNIEPKKIRFVYPKKGMEANMLLVEGIKNGKLGLKILPPLIVHNEDGSYTKEVKKMFGGEEYVAKKL